MRKVRNDMVFLFLPNSITKSWWESKCVSPSGWCNGNIRNGVWGRPGRGCYYRRSWSRDQGSDWCSLSNNRSCWTPNRSWCSHDWSCSCFNDWCSGGLNDWTGWSRNRSLDNRLNRGSVDWCLGDDRCLNDGRFIDGDSGWILWLNSRFIGIDSCTESGIICNIVHCTKSSISSSKTIGSDHLTCSVSRLTSESSSCQSIFIVSKSVVPNILC